MKKLVSLVLTAVFAVSSCISLAGCQAQPAASSGATTKAEETTTGSKGSDEAKPAAGDFKVGAIYINSQNDTSGYTFAHHKGIRVESLAIIDSMSDTSLTFREQ